MRQLTAIDAHRPSHPILTEQAACLANQINNGLLLVALLEMVEITVSLRAKFPCTKLRQVRTNV